MTTAMKKFTNTLMVEGPATAEPITATTGQRHNQDSGRDCDPSQARFHSLTAHQTRSTDMSRRPFGLK